MCKECEHPLLWHGDRAICACDGGWDRIQTFHRNVKPGEGVSLCPCPGWRG